ncbi:MAG: ATP-binding protein [Methanospirillum sp.]
MRLLLVEDNPLDAELIRELLAEFPQYPFSVRHESNLAAARAALAEEKVDLVLLDLGLPDSQGMATVRDARAAAPGVPIVVLTGLDDEDVGVRALQEGAQDYLAKGWMNGPALVRSIRYAEERNRTGAELVRKNAELAAQKEKLAERKERLKRAQEIAHIGSWEFAGGELSWSDETYRICGARPQEFAATYDTFLASVHPDDRAGADAAYRDSVRDRRDGYEVEYRIVRRSDGVVRQVYERCTHVRDGVGRIIRSDGTVHDITEWKEAEDTLKRYAAELERSNEELQRFAYVASHDLQEPLRSIISFSQLLERRYKGKLDPDADDSIGFIVDGGNRMQALITDLLTVSRVTTTAAPIVETDAGEVVAGVVCDLADAIATATATITVGPMPPVMADAAQLEQVFANLIGNAIKYRRPRVPPRIAVFARAGPMVEFAVRDNGIGIEAEYFDRIFEMFRRLHTHDEYEGTGIGLAVVKRIVDRHGGTVRVESVPGEGTTFFFTLPAA